MLYSVIIPCYRSSETIRKVVEETMQEFVHLDVGQVEFVLVDDCSPDNGATVRELRSLVADYSNVRAVELAANSGQHNALMAGLNYAKGDYKTGRGIQGGSYSTFTMQIKTIQNIY